MPFYLDKGGIHAFAQIFPIRRAQAHASGRPGFVRPARGGYDHAARQRGIRHDRMDQSVRDHAGRLHPDRFHLHDHGGGLCLGRAAAHELFQKRPHGGRQPRLAQTHRHHLGHPQRAGVHHGVHHAVFQRRHLDARHPVTEAAHGNLRRHRRVAGHPDHEPAGPALDLGAGGAGLRHEHLQAVLPGGRDHVRDLRLDRRRFAAAEPGLVPVQKLRGRAGCGDRGPGQAAFAQRRVSALHLVRRRHRQPGTIHRWHALQLDCG